MKVSTNTFSVQPEGRHLPSVLSRSKSGNCFSYHECCHCIFRHVSHYEISYLKENLCPSPYSHYY